MTQTEVSALALILAILLAMSSASRAAADPTLHDLQDVEAFRARFNQDAGAMRVVLLLSPT